MGSNSGSQGRGRTWARALIVVALLVVAGGIAAWIAIPRLLDINTYRTRIEAEVSQRLGRPISIGRMEFSAFPLPTAVIHELTIGGQGLEGQWVLRAPTLRARARLFPLLAERRLELVDLELENPAIALVRDASGRWNWPTMLEPRTSGTAAGDGARSRSSAWQLDRVTITQGTVRILDQQVEAGRPLTWTLQPIDLDLRTHGPGQPLDVALDLVLAAETGRGALHYRGRVGPFPTPFDAARLPLAGDLKAERFPLRAVLPYVRRADGIQALDGFLTSDLHLASRPDGEMKLQGDLELDQVRYALGGTAPRAGVLDFAAQLDLSATHQRQDLDLRQLELILPDGRLALRGEVRQGGRLALRLDGQQVSVPALAPLAAFAGFELPVAMLGTRPFDIEGKIERPTTGSRLLVRDLHLRGIAATLTSAGSAGRGAPAPGTSPAGFEAENLWIEGSTLTVGDPSAPIRLTDVDLKLDHYVAGRPGRGSLTASLPGGGRVSFNGALGPAAVGELPIDGQLALDGAQLAALRPLLSRDTSKLPAEGAIDLDATVRGRMPAALAIKGNGRVKLPSGDFTFSGTVDRQGSATLVDLSVAPTRMKIEELQAVAASAGIALPGTMRSPDPVEVALHARGNLQDRRQLRLDGQLKTTRMTWEAPFLGEPLKEVAGTVRFTGDGFEAKSFTATLGQTTWRGDLTVQNLGAPRVTFALAADRADLGQLMTALGRRSSSGAGTAAGAPASNDLLSKATGGGTIAVKGGTFNAVAFSDLQAKVALDGRTIRLAPLGFGLYGGKYSGESVVDLRSAVPTIQHDCALVGVDANGLLSTNSKLQDVLHGTLSARFSGTGSGQTTESLLGTLAGTGELKVMNGTLTRASMLKGLSEVAGLFGERTLTQLSQRMSTDETPFSELSATFQIAGGQLTTDNLSLQTTDFGLAAKGRVALDRRLGLQGRIVFSDLVSRLLREEGSRAIYLGEQNGRVAIPVAVSGTLDRPSFSVDFGAAAGYAVGKTITDRLVDALQRRPAPPNTTSAPPEPPAPQPAEEPPAPAAADLRVRVDSHQFRGDRAQPDLAVKGAVSGSHLAELLVIVSDDGGKLLLQEKRLAKEIAAAYGARPRSESVTVPFDFQIAGNRLPRTTKSVRMTLVAVADNGKTSPPAAISQQKPRNLGD